MCSGKKKFGKKKTTINAMLSLIKVLPLVISCKKVRSIFIAQKRLPVHVYIPAVQLLAAQTAASEEIGHWKVYGYLGRPRSNGDGGIRWNGTSLLQSGDDAEPDGVRLSFLPYLKRPMVAHRWGGWNQEWVMVRTLDACCS